MNMKYTPWFKNVKLLISILEDIETIKQETEKLEKRMKDLIHDVKENEKDLLD